MAPKSYIVEQISGAIKMLVVNTARQFLSLGLDHLIVKKRNPPKQPSNRALVERGHHPSDCNVTATARRASI
jgi:hypothetical protein